MRYIMLLKHTCAATLSMVPVEIHVDESWA